MAVIQKIQKQTGCLLLLIGAAMVAFVLTDLISSRNSIFGNVDNTIGEIRGEKIDYNIFEQNYNELLKQMKIGNPEAEITEEIRESYREQAWNMIIQEKIIKKEHDVLGITVSGKELADITVGANVHQRIQQAFTNQETQLFDRARLVKFIQEDIEADEEMKYKWINFFELPLKEELMGQKYSVLIKSAIYVNKLDAIVEDEENTKALSGQVAGLQYNTLSDSAVKYDDRDLKSYFNKNKDEFKHEASSDIEFVLFDVIPTRKDTLDAQRWTQDNIEKLKNAKDDSVFVDIMGSETPFDPSFKARGNFPEEVDDLIFVSDSGTIIGPNYKDGVFTTYKVSKVSSDSFFSIRASHILTFAKGGTTADTLNAENEARKVLAEIRSGKKTFEEIARNNIDPTASKGGDLGWLREKDDKMPEKFMSELLRHNMGDYFVVSTSLGTHLVKVTANKSKRTAQVAIMTKTIEASSETDKEAYRKAGELASLAQQEKDFEKLAESKKYAKNVAEKIKEKDRNIPGVKNAAPIIRWLFDEETKKGSVSEVLEVDNKYVVVKCSAKRKEGYPKLEEVKDQIIQSVIKEKKGVILEEKVKKALAKSKTMADLAAALNTDLQEIPNQNFKNNYVPSVGNDSKVLATIFAVKHKQFSPAIISDNGVFVVWVHGEIAAQNPNMDIPGLQRSLMENYKSRMEGQVLEALKATGKIKDYRYKYL
jgi:peptidyl-prolyl cis-trans isomerase D